MRKSIYGRTQLFLPSDTAVLREVKCLGGAQAYASASVFHILPELKDKTDLCCWHCTERCETMLPIPKCFDSYEKAFYVFGAVCSPGCAKAYILEHSSFDRGQQLNVLMKMLHEVYGLTDLVNETPPRAALKKFGGPFDPRQSAPEGSAVTRRLVQPPFVSYSMVVEERQEAATANLPRFVPRPPEDADAFEEPPEEALFASYVAARQASG
tara:strand:- start:3134 stop:3766 length:633 start_codon:yes stop_codon:yes gene_type:complete